jgi:hypothetical protein
MSKKVKRVPASTPRNTVAVAMRMRKGAGTHTKPNKVERIALKRQLKKGVFFVVSKCPTCA